MKYPRMPEKKDRRYKIVPSEREAIREFRDDGWTIQKIANYYSVSITTIRHILYPDEKEKALKRIRERNKSLRQDGGEEYLQKERKRNSERRKYARKVNPKINEYYGWLTNIKHKCWKKHNKLRWKKIKNNPKLLKGYNAKMRKWVDENRDYVNQKHRENYKKRIVNH